VPRQRPEVPGSTYLNGKRFWWDVRLPGEAPAPQTLLAASGPTPGQVEILSETPTVALAFAAAAKAALPTSDPALAPDDCIVDLLALPKHG